MQQALCAAGAHLGTARSSIEKSTPRHPRVWRKSGLWRAFAEPAAAVAEPAAAVAAVRVRAQLSPMKGSRLHKPQHSQEG